MTRRTFLESLASAAVLGAGGCSMFRWKTGKIRLAVAGPSCGSSEWLAMLESGLVEVVAFCDSNPDAKASVERHLSDRRIPLDVGSVPFFSDTDELVRNLDALEVEALADLAPLAVRGSLASAAAEKGVHVYVGAPLAGTISELALFDHAVRSTRAITQMGDVSSAADGLRRGVELLNAGIIGATTEVHAWGSGLFESAPNVLNLVQRGLELSRVKSVRLDSAEGRVDGGIPARSSLTLLYAARLSRIHQKQALPEVRLAWYDGGMKPPAEVTKPVADVTGSVPAAGCIVKGAGGILFAADGFGMETYISTDGARAVPSDEHPGAIAVRTTIPRRGAKDAASAAQVHALEFVDAVMRSGPKYGETGSRTYSGAQHSVPFTEGLLVASVAQRVLHPGDTLKWDTAFRHFDRADANALIRPATSKK